MNKKWISMILAMVLLVSNIIVVFAKSYTAKVTEVSGTVTVQRQGSSRTFNAFQNMSIDVGDKISTDYDGSATIIVNDKNIIELGRNTSITLNDLSNIEDSPVTAYTVHFGSVTNDVKSKGFNFFDYSVNVINTVMGVRGTIFEVSRKINEDGNEKVQLITAEGEVIVDEINYYENIQRSLREEKASVFAEQTIYFVEDYEKRGNVQGLDVSKLDVDQLRWLEKNKEHLSEATKELVSTNLELALELEQQKIEEFSKLAKENKHINYMFIEDNNAGGSNANWNNAGGNGNSNNNGKDEEDEEDKEDEEDVEDNYIEAVPPIFVIDPNDPIRPTEEEDKTYSFIVGNPAELVAVNEFLLNNSNYGAVNIKLSANIDFAGETWIPVDIHNVTFDGNGKTLSNVNIEQQITTTRTTSLVQLGIFKNAVDSEIFDLKLSNITIGNDTKDSSFSGVLAGTISDSVVKNIKLENSTVYGDTSGGLLGKVNSSEIEDIVIKNTSVTGDRYSGMLAGVIYESNVDNVDLKNANVYGVYYTGGLAGMIENSNLKNIKTQDNNATGIHYVGGVVGKITNSTMEHMEIKQSNIIGEKCVGGFAGIVEGDVNNVHINKSTIKALDGKAGGIAGEIIGSISAVLDDGIVIDEDDADEIYNGDITENHKSRVLVVGIEVESNNGYAAGLSPTISGDVKGVVITNSTIRSIGSTAAKVAVTVQGSIEKVVVNKVNVESTIGSVVNSVELNLGYSRTSSSSVVIGSKN